MPALRDPVDNAALREAFLRARREGVSPSAVARELGWTYRDRRWGVMPAPGRLKRRLGLMPSVTVRDGRRWESVQTMVEYEDAVRIALALGVDPVSVGV